SFTGLRVFLRTASIQFSPSPVSIVHFYKELVQTVAHVMVRPPTTDPSNLTNVSGNEGFVAAGAAGSSSSVVRGGKDMVLRSRLWEYLHLEEGTCCFLNDVVATVGECFRALVRHFRTQADKAKVDSSAANVYLCPPLHESFQLLSQLPVAPSADLLQSYRDAMLAKGEDDSVRRRYLLEILAPNYRAAMARDGSVTFSHTSTIQDLPISFLSTVKQRERERGSRGHAHQRTGSATVDTGDLQRAIGCLSGWLGQVIPPGLRAFIGKSFLRECVPSGFGWTAALLGHHSIPSRV
ncbi:unnamed protein product, partial [Vitrella brassicaformis CCMP3155]